MLYLFLIFAVWLLYKRIKTHCELYPYQPLDDDPHPPEQSHSPPDYDTPAHIERLQTVRREYLLLLDAIEQEQDALRREYEQANVPRQSQITSKLTALQGKHAATTARLTSIDNKLCKLYDSQLCPLD